MKSRGRPRTDDILTPREWEVLELLRKGLSNRDIAERLSLSLAGAKSHVSEIIGKLGVSTREEAAAWRPRRHRAFGLSALAFWRELPLPFAFTPKLAAAVVSVPLAIGGIAAAALAFGGERAVPNLRTTASQAPATPESVHICQPPQCYQPQAQNFATLQEAADIASFQPKLPSRLPQGYHAYRIEYTRFMPAAREVHNDWIFVYYRTSDGRNLAIAQGFGEMARGLVMSQTQLVRGSVDVEGRDATWARLHWLERSSFPLAPIDRLPNGTPLPGLGKPAVVLSLEVGRFGPGWNVAPDRQSIEYGSPMSYSLMSDSLSLEELTEIARSVAFD